MRQNFSSQWEDFEFMEIVLSLIFVQSSEDDTACTGFDKEKYDENRVRLFFNLKTKNNNNKLIN